MTANAASPSEYARRNVEWFTRRFGAECRKLARYAALPLVLTPDLVAQLRSRYLNDIDGVAEVDLLLSDLCTQVGYEQYVMNPDVRAYLIAELDNDLKETGAKDIQDVAGLLLEYVGQLGRALPSASEPELQAQRWAAMVYLDDQRDNAVSEITRAFRNYVAAANAGNGSAGKQRAELLRLASIVDILAPELQRYPTLLTYVRSVGNILTAAPRQAPEIARQAHAPTVVMQIYLPPPDTLSAIPPTPWVAAAEGLRGLVGLLRAPRVRTAAATAKADLQATNTQIPIIRSYMRLLHQFDQLRYACYDGMVLEAAHFSDSPNPGHNIQAFERQLDDIIRQMSVILDQSPFPTSQAVWVPLLSRAREHLHKARTLANTDQFSQALRVLRRILDRYPAQVAAQLARAVGAARLPELLRDLEQIRELLGDLALPADEVQSFEVGVDALDTLIEDLRLVVAEQKAWQFVDPDLRLSEESLKYNTRDIARYWRNIKGTVEPLYSQSADAWAVALRAAGTELEFAIAERNSEQIRRSLRAYSGQASIRWWCVGREIRILSDQLQQVGQSLADVLSMLE